MAFIARRSRRLIVAAVVLFAVVAGGAAYATIPDATGVYTACKLRITGTIRLIDKTPGAFPAGSLLARCTSFEDEITWSHTGPQGIQGIQGLQGIQGPQGPKGDQGPAGNDGKNGTNGVSGYYIQWNSNYVSGSGDVHWLYAYCNYGDKVLGGGYVITNGSGDRNNTVVTESAPFNDSTWEVTMINNNTEYITPGYVNFRVYATCAKAN
jgi:Collagen triple helix repeat (20 copies)